jgi:hypothetical protein
MAQSNNANLNIFIKDGRISTEKSCASCFAVAGIWAVLHKEFRKIRDFAFCTSLHDQTRTVKGSMRIELLYKVELRGKASLSSKSSFEEYL